MTASVVPLRKPLTPADIIGRKIASSIHIDMSRSQSAWIYSLEGIPRLKVYDEFSRKTGKTRVWLVDDKSVHDLDAALAVLNGEKKLEDILAAQEEKANEKPLRRRTSIEGQVEEVAWELDQRAQNYPRVAGRDARKQSELQLHTTRMEDVKATLEFCRDNRPMIAQVHALLKNGVPPGAEADHDLASLPRTIEENNESYVVVAANGYKLAYIYFEDEPVRRGSMKRLKKAAALALAHQIAALPPQPDQ